MDQTSSSDKVAPVQQTSPEEDPTLLAIEALEARTVDLDAKPIAPPAAVTPAPVVQPVVTPPTPVVPKVVPQPPATLNPEPAKPIVIAPVPIKPVETPKPTPVAVPKPIEPPKPPEPPKKPATTAEKIAEELANAPAPKMFQFFINQGVPRKAFVIAGVIIVVVGLGIGGYFILH